MFIREVKKPNGSVSIRIVESTRVKNKVIQKVIRTLGQHKDAREIAIIKKAAQDLIIELKNTRNPALPGMEETVHSTTCTKKASTRNPELVDIKNLSEQDRVNQGIHTVLGKVYNQMNFNDIIKNTKKDDEWNSILQDCVLARISRPQSKRKTADSLKKVFSKPLPLHKIYRMMDRVFLNEERLKSKVLNSTLNLFNDQVDVMFFDVTTLYFESFTSDELRANGFSKDAKFKETQVVLALVTNSQGHPVTYELFPGNTYEGNTLIEIVKNLKTRFNVNQVTLVADRGMFNEANLVLLEAENIHYIVGAKLKSLPKNLKEEICHKNFKPHVVSNELQWVREFEHKKRRLVVGYSNKRAYKDAFDREKIIVRLLKKAKDGKLKASDLITNYGTKKYLKSFKGDVEVDKCKISRDAQWDGFHGVITNLEDKSAAEVLERYRGLWKIEQAFRISKTDLKMRPIFHWKSERIKAHIGICFLAYAIVCRVNKLIKENQLEFSFLDLKEELNRDEYSVLKDSSTGRFYELVSKTTPVLKKIYQVLNLKRKDCIRLVKEQM